MKKADILKTCQAEDVRFLRLQFSDIFGINKNVEVPASQFEKALDGEIMFDGSSVDGFSRIEESDMVLNPDYNTFAIMPFSSPHGKVARIICDVMNPDGTPFAGCPRQILKRVCARAETMGYTMAVGPEAEFFLFQLDDQGNATLKTHDAAGYFDMAPSDLAEEARQEMVNVMIQMGFEVEAAHHEVAHGQHEIDFKYADAVTTADNISTFKLIVRKVAQQYGLHATFMPKPIFGINGSGMHTNMSLFKDDANAFYAPNAEFQLSDAAHYYIGGILKHVRSFLAITNPLVNSYKRLVPGYEAPINVAWSERNRSPLVRVPAKRGNSTRIEVRVPDPACNPYLALAVMLAAGLDGIENRLTPPPPVNKNIFAMSQREKRRLRIDELPSNLLKSVEAMEKSKLMRETLGDHVFFHFIASKRQEWSRYISQVHKWEVDNYLTLY
ncbi:MAG: type I glutamate--ammonia ligase [Calditrichaeota bacterium]|nr:type I glutamate--ammonia ligase [Calditrichota bacterium]MCB0292131.1 type I glutamate--ammonia ligase [Calditrichota bacterium]MCB0305877.1 type I glutamate--ammonia ligase [Calditrichota bacterium]MCB9086965.1 type I glutamate--ammonia ligase [Calditrichia bacterium]